MPKATPNGLIYNIGEEAGQQVDKKEPAGFLSGGRFSDFIDILNVGNYAVAGAVRAGREEAERQEGRGVAALPGIAVEAVKGIVPGIKERDTFVDILQDKYPDMPFWASFSGGLLADIVLDPNPVGKIVKLTKPFQLLSKGSKKTLDTMKAVGDASEVTSWKNNLGKAAVGFETWFKAPTQKLPEEFLKMQKYNEINKQAITKKLEEVFEPLSKEDFKMRREILEVAAGKETSDIKIRSWANFLRKEFDDAGLEISKLDPKLLDPKKVQDNLGKYVTIFYEQRKQFRFSERFSRADKAQFGLEKIMGMTTEQAKNYLKTLSPQKIEELARKYEKSLGRIDDAAFIGFSALKKLKGTISDLKFLEDVNKKFAVSADNIHKFGFEQMGNSKMLGPLKGKVLPKHIADSVNAMFPKQTPKWMDMYLKGLRMWKLARIFNPGTISRNNITNYSIMAPMSGMAPWRVDLYFKAAKDLAGQGPMYERAVRQGLELTTIQVNDLGRTLKKTWGANQAIGKKIFGKFKDFTDWASGFYGNQDKFFKMASFRKSVMEDGLTDWQAMRKAAYYFIDYSDMPRAIEFLKNAPFGQPFISFNYGISRPLAKTLLEDPKKIGDFFKMMRDVQKAHPGNKQIDDRTKFEENLPTWVQENRELYMAFADPNNPNKAEVINWEYVIPRGLIEDFDGYYDFILGMAGKKGAKSLESIRTVPLMNAPYVTIPSDIIYNQSRFTGREIVNMNDSPSTQLFKRMEYVWKQVAPNWPGLPWSYNTDMFQNAGFFPRLGERGEIFFETTERGEEKGALRALLNNFGIKSLPVDLEAEAVKKIKAKKWNLIELNKLMNQVKRSKFLPEAEKEKQIEELKEQRKRIQAGEV